MSACLLVGSSALWLASGVFTLEWTHSVEKVAWRETWRVSPAGLVAQEAAVKGSGAGMEPEEGARLRNGWWEWRPDAPPLSRLLIARSGATGAPWRLCADSRCRTLSEDGRTDPLELAPCGAPPEP